MHNLNIENLCICKDQRHQNNFDQCINSYTYRENGKSVQLKSSSREQVKIVVVDNCLIQSTGVRKCDCIFLYKKRNRQVYSILVELKGANHIPSAFEQLKNTLDSPQYQSIVQQLGNVIKKCFIVSSGQMDAAEIQKYENTYGIRVARVVHSLPTTPIPDLKEWL